MRTSITLGPLHKQEGMCPAGLAPPHVGPPKVRLSPLQSVLNAAARLIAPLLGKSHISALMFYHLHC